MAGLRPFEHLSECAVGARRPFVIRVRGHGRRAGPDVLSHSIRDMSGLKTVEADFLTHKARAVLSECHNGEIASQREVY
jgi:hypothetical protein